VSSIILGPGVAFIAPIGTDPDDHASWQAIGTTGPINLVLDEPEPPPMVWPPGSRTITSRRSMLTWYGHWVLFRRAHPRARRVKTAYHRRRR